jgi:hypothetical protein
MRPKYLLLLLWAVCHLVAIQPLSAQLHPLAKDVTTCVFGDKVNVRSEAQPDAPVVGQLNGGTTVTILEVSEKQYSVNGNSQPWYRVRYNKDQTGFVWGGLLSLTGEKQGAGVRFAVGMTAFKEKKEKGSSLVDFTLEARVYNGNGVLLAKTAQVFTNFNGSDIYADSVAIGARGLKGYSALLISHIGIEACGYPNDTWYVLWDGKQLVSLPVCTSIGEAGLFYDTHYYSFPADQNSWDRRSDTSIFYVEEHSESGESGAETEEINIRVRELKWDGAKFVVPKKRK